MLSDYRALSAVIHAAETLGDDDRVWLRAIDYLCLKPPAVDLAPFFRVMQRQVGSREIPLPNLKMLVGSECQISELHVVLNGHTIVLEEWGEIRIRTEAARAGAAGR